jgi:cation transport protein ChaC
MLSWRATPKQPGLMMCLESSGRCEGLLARVPDGLEREVARALVKREIAVEEDISMVRWATTRTNDGPVRAILFWAGPKPGEGIASRLPLPEVAHRMARACGHKGSNAEYLYNTVTHLEELGIRDRNLWTLQKLVAAEIRTLTGP